MASEKTDEKQGAGKWEKGQSGNPYGRPKGSRNKATLLAQTLLEGEAENLARKAVEMALNGNPLALKLCLERILPPLKDRPIQLDLPKIASLPMAGQAMSQILDLVSAGEVTPQEGHLLVSALSVYVKNQEIIELERRMRALEKTLLRRKQ